MHKTGATKARERKILADARTEWKRREWMRTQRASQENGRRKMIREIRVEANIERVEAQGDEIQKREKGKEGERA